MSQVVLDASIALSWCFEDEGGREQLRILDRLTAGMEAVVPAVWILEVINAGMVGQRRGRISADAFISFITQLIKLPIAIDHPKIAGSARAIINLSLTFSLSSYDASYLELAARAGLPLLTLDTRLRSAARKAGISTSMPG